MVPQLDPSSLWLGAVLLALGLVVHKVLLTTGRSRSS
jgi:hypothetical protein